MSVTDLGVIKSSNLDFKLSFIFCTCTSPKESWHHSVTFAFVKSLNEIKSFISSVDIPVVPIVDCV